MSDDAEPSSLTVLHVLNRDHRRGAETFAVDLAAHMRPLVASLRVVALQAGSGPGLPGVEVLGSRDRIDVRMRALRSAAREVDVVVAHGSSTLAACALGLVGTGVPFVYRVIGEPRYWSSSLARRLRVRAYLTRAARVVAYYPAATDQLVDGYDVARSRTRVIPKGIDPLGFAPVAPAERSDRRNALGIEPATRVVVYVGALSPEKNVEQAIDAVARRARDGDRIELIALGDGPSRPALEARAQRAAAPVRFVGASSDPAAWCAVADAAVLTSRTEGVPSSIIEAGLMGLPVVATAVGGVGTVVVDGQTGYLVPVGDVGATAVALGRALDTGPAMGARGRRRCLESFAVHVTARRWVDLLDEVVQEPPRRRRRGSRAKSPSTTRR